MTQMRNLKQEKMVSQMMWMFSCPKTKMKEKLNGDTEERYNRLLNEFSESHKKKRSVKWRY